MATRTGALLIVAFDPIAAGVLRSPGDWGADVVVGEGQALGHAAGLRRALPGAVRLPLDQVRRLPGRLVGETVDAEGRRAYVTTLRAREQDIRREKATSNVCTNQTLMAVTAAIQLGWLGTSGLRRGGAALRRRARYYLRRAFWRHPGVEPLSDAPCCASSRSDSPCRRRVAIERLADEGFLAGVACLDEATPVVARDADDGSWWP